MRMSPALELRVAVLESRQTRLLFKNTQVSCSRCAATSDWGRQPEQQFEHTTGRWPLLVNVHAALILPSWAPARTLQVLQLLSSTCASVHGGLHAVLGALPQTCDLCAALQAASQLEADVCPWASQFWHGIVANALTADGADIAVPLTASQCGEAAEARRAQTVETQALAAFERASLSEASIDAVCRDHPMLTDRHVALAAQLQRALPILRPAVLHHRQQQRQHFCGLRRQPHPLHGRRRRAASGQCDHRCGVVRELADSQ